MIVTALGSNDGQFLTIFMKVVISIALV